MKNPKSPVGAASAAITAVAQIKAEFAAEAAPTGGAFRFGKNQPGADLRASPEGVRRREAPNKLLKNPG
ncbi:MAG: hypothetical protein KJ558_16565 [Gammaproteobacteria bacterium]|nr:hypothetical protein [Gammaproteobacteria bacterium]MBU1656405.1 hypothetical protein [Gammaproteobacteria bacterium]MBU1960953.1 hypothetical protein [Gammaproteobacteria bacterium]